MATAEPDGWLEVCEPFVQGNESCRLTAYLDTLAKPPVWTVGWGATGTGITAGTVWTQSRADADLRDRLLALANQIVAVVDVPLNRYQLSALVDFAYEEGFGAFRASTLLRKLNQGDYGGAANEFAAWDKAGGVVVPGIASRRARDVALFNEQPTAPTAQPIAPAQPVDSGQPSFLAVLVRALWGIVRGILGRR